MTTTAGESWLVAEADSARKHGDLFKAYDLAMAGLEQHPDSAGLQYIAVRALADAGATGSAQEHYQRFGLAAKGGVDERSLGARLLKDIAFEGEPASAERLREAADAYQRIFAQTSDYFPGINAATLYMLAGDKEKAERIARALLGEPSLRLDRGYYGAATMAEAELLLDHPAEAKQSLVRARQLAGDDYGALATTRRQLSRILKHRGLDPQQSDLLAPLTIPQIAFYCGHMVTGAAGLEEEWQTVLAGKIEAAIGNLPISAAFGGLACGADILFAEACLRRKIELHVVLPFKQDDYLRYSVEPGGAPWVQRFHDCVARATDVTFATFEDYVGDPTIFSYGSLVAMGMARLRARHLQTGAVQLAALDGGSTGTTGGTAEMVDLWRRFGGKTEVVEFARSATGHRREQPAVEVQRAAERRQGRGIHSIIFGDVHGFSKITEAHLPNFWNGIMTRFAGVIDAHKDKVLFRNTWGDAIHLIIDDIETAAELALSMHSCITPDDAKALGLPTMPSLRVALHHGPLYTGYDPICQEQTWFGSELSRTARIEPITPLGAVYATEPFAALLALRAGARYACHYAGRIELAKGYGAYRMYRLTKQR